MTAQHTFKGFKPYSFSNRFMMYLKEIHKEIPLCSIRDGLEKEVIIFLFIHSMFCQNIECNFKKYDCGNKIALFNSPNLKLLIFSIELHKTNNQF